MTEEHVDGLYHVYQRARLALEVFVVVVLVAALSLLIYMSINGRAARGDLQRNARLLIECTTPPLLREPPEHQVKASDCYLRQQAASVSFSAPGGPLATLATAAAACGAAHPADIEATRNCVVEGLRANDRDSHGS